MLESAVMQAKLLVVDDLLLPAAMRADHRRCCWSSLKMVIQSHYVAETQDAVLRPLLSAVLLLM